MKSARVLVVDDNRDLAENICDIVSAIDNYEVECAIATDGEEARQLCAKLHVTLDVALVDLRLPDSDGIALIRAIRERCSSAETVIITGDATLESAVAAVGGGAFAFVLKPFQPRELQQTVVRALAKVGILREREALRVELEVSERRHREVVEAVPAFVLALDVDGRIALWNRHLEAVTGRPRSEMLGKPGRELVGEGGDRRLPLSRGGHRLVRWQLTHLSDPAAPITYALGMDVTEERTMLRRTLRAERLAAVGTLAAGMAHEVRNPLNSATLQLQVLRRRIEKGQATPDALMPVVSIVLEEIRRLERLVNDFLSFARPTPLSTAPTQLDDLVRAVLEQLGPELQTHGLSLERQLAALGTWVDVDAERLRQVLINLMRNAAEAMHDTGRLTVRTRSADAAGFACIEIEDTGPGIAEDAPVFDAFFTTKESGTGLGLAIVHRIVEEHGGTISYESQPGRTCFFVRLPEAAPTSLD